MAKAAASLAVEPSSAPVVFRGFPHEGSTSFTEGIIPSTPIASPASLGSIIRNLSDWILCVYGRQRLRRTAHNWVLWRGGAASEQQCYDSGMAW